MFSTFLHPFTSCWHTGDDVRLSDVVKLHMTWENAAEHVTIRKYKLAIKLSYTSTPEDDCLIVINLASTPCACVLPSIAWLLIVVYSGLHRTSVCEAVGPSGVNVIMQKMLACRRRSLYDNQWFKCRTSIVQSVSLWVLGQLCTGVLFVFIYQWTLLNRTSNDSFHRNCFGFVFCWQKGVR